MLGTSPLTSQGQQGCFGLVIVRAERGTLSSEHVSRTGALQYPPILFRMVPSVGLGKASNLHNGTSSSSWWCLSFGIARHKLTTLVYLEWAPHMVVANGIGIRSKTSEI